MTNEGFILNSLQNLRDDFLIDAYTDSIRLKLSTEFITILLGEIKRRNLFV